MTSERRRRAPPKAAIFCPWCGQPTAMDYAHGHAQCVHCKTNIAPCCDGETAAATCVPPRRRDA
ncbi:MAG: hypothetical protein KC486_33345 [Myxococcales bacterium]|nr:hypothetical protein [Myxococcales bacterium]